MLSSDGNKLLTLTLSSAETLTSFSESDMTKTSRENIRLQVEKTATKKLDTQTWPSRCRRVMQSNAHASPACASPIKEQRKRQTIKRSTYQKYRELYTLQCGQEVKDAGQVDRIPDRLVCPSRLKYIGKVDDEHQYRTELPV